MKKLLILLIPILSFGQGNESLLNGDWDIVSLEYSSAIDLSDIPTIGIFLGVQEFSGEADDAGTWSFNSNDYTYAMDLDFQTEAFTISIPLAGDFDMPSIPVQNNSSGTWVLTQGGDMLVITDGLTTIESSYEIIALSNDIGVISGVVPFSQDIAGMSFNLEIELEMVLEKQENNSDINELAHSKELIKIIDFLGKETSKRGFNLEIYNDGTVQKKYLMR